MLILSLNLCEALPLTDSGTSTETLTDAMVGVSNPRGKPIIDNMVVIDNHLHMKFLLLIMIIDDMIVVIIIYI